ncbi:FKBP-type peptidyl-prolyl cis-trans isomerase [Rathayibacter sp. YIM 133350]|uniref:FKBP-type peptidyl-prolyl cis-trans isomerase n=1 Tax=Rathayibacter sp. YIM 133350 TaxID=3131992 RepID=UPI00307EF366
MRKLPALIAAAGLIAVGLTACSSGPADCTGGAPSGDASSIVTAKGDFGSAPDVDFPTPMQAPKTQRSTIVDGHGEGLITGQKAVIDMAVYNGTTGDLIEKTDYSDDVSKQLSVVVSSTQVQKGLAKGLTCAKPGSRIAIVVPPKDAFGSAGNAGIGLSGKDDLVFVVDVKKAYLTRADGAPQPAQSGFPSVVLDHTGRPGLTIPDEKAPKTLKVAQLKKGDGRTVKKGDTVTVHYTGVVWSSKEVFDSSWERGAPASLVAASGADVQGGVIEGFADALIGQPVGSQVLAIIPPSKGYGDQAQSSIPANSTLVFVVDILGIG